LQVSERVDVMTVARFGQREQLRSGFAGFMVAKKEPSLAT